MSQARTLLIAGIAGGLLTLGGAGVGAYFAIAWMQNESAKEEQPNTPDPDATVLGTSSLDRDRVDEPEVEEQNDVIRDGRRVLPRGSSMSFGLDDGISTYQIALMYGARSVAFTKEAERDLKLVESLGLTDLPICIAKAPSSLSDDPALRGRPRDFEVTVRGIQVNRGAGFLVVLTGNIMRMPGLPKVPEAMKYALLPDGTIDGMS